MDEVKTRAMIDKTYHVLEVFFENGTMQSFIVEEGATIVSYPLETVGTPAYVRITHTDGDVEDVYLHHADYTRYRKSSRRVFASVPVDDTPAPRTDAPQGTSHGASKPGHKDAP